MDDAVTLYYKELLKTGFKYAGSIDNPSLLLDYEKTEGVLCGKSGNSLYLYVNIKDDIITEIKYLCTCDPTMNVVVEVLCTLVEGKPVTVVKDITEEMLSQVIGSRNDRFLNRAAIVIEVFKQGIMEFELSPKQ